MRGALSTLGALVFGFGSFGLVTLKLNGDFMRLMFSKHVSFSCLAEGFSL